MDPSLRQLTKTKKVLNYGPSKFEFEPTIRTMDDTPAGAQMIAIGKPAGG